MPSSLKWNERRDLYPEGVASGDPDSSSVLLWTRHAPNAKNLTVEVAEDKSFRRVIATAPAPISAASDWTCRVLVGGLKPASVYWYRFTDEDGNGSRIGRTLTAPADDDPRPVRFAFVSCQNVNRGRAKRLSPDDLRRRARCREDRLGFVLHLGDFIYEIVWYPEDRPQGNVRPHASRHGALSEHGEKIEDFHIPTTLDDYRAVYRAYLHDPDLQDARARWPFVNMWDNHEFSWQGWQSMQKFDGKARPAQTRKVAANQAWFEYQPARVAKPSGPSLDRSIRRRSSTRRSHNSTTTASGNEPNNLTAIDSLKGYRAHALGTERRADHHRSAQLPI